MQNAPHVNPIDKALWYIESHLAGDLDLETVAQAAGVTRFHMTRAFGLATGRSIMRYVRARRLSQAARALVDGEPDILALAIAWGYGSHEAFTRAFRDEFGVTPEAARARGGIDSLELTEPLTMNEDPLPNLAPPRFVDAPAMLVAGIGERYTYESSAGIPGQWNRFAPRLGHIPGQKGKVAYGVVFNADDAGNMEYLSGVEVGDYTKLPADLARLRIPEHRYAVFRHDGHVSSIRRVWAAIFKDWQPGSGRKIADAPSFERYDEKFDGKTGNGGFEIWVPVTRLD
jgi:AraC family transcriptional regulator